MTFLEVASKELDGNLLNVIFYCLLSSHFKSLSYRFPLQVMVWVGSLKLRQRTRGPNSIQRCFFEYFRLKIDLLLAAFIRNFTPIVTGWYSACNFRLSKHRVHSFCKQFCTRILFSLIDSWCQFWLTWKCSGRRILFS